jgi:hypothetical protein
MRPKPDEEGNRRSLTEGDPQNPLTEEAPYKGASQAPGRSARPCSATASRSVGGAGAKASPRPLSPAPALKREERT